jgi:hypothetical protein
MNPFQPLFKVVEIGGLWWRIRLLDPALAAQAGVLLQMVGTAISNRPASGSLPRQVDEKEAARIQEAVLMACVVGMGASETEIAPILLVAKESHDPEQGRIWPGVLVYAEVRDRVGDKETSTPLATLLLLACLEQLMEARQVLTPFRSGPKGPVHAGQGGDPVRPDAGGTAPTTGV